MKKTFSAITAILLAVVLIFTLASCKKEDNEQNIRDAIETAMNGVLTSDEKVLKKQVESTLLDTLNANLNLIPDGEKIVAALLKDASYEISADEGSINIDNNAPADKKGVSATATTKITITAKDLKKKAAAYQLKVYAGAVGGTVDLTDKKYLTGEVERVLGIINAADVQMVSTPMTLELEKHGGTWVVILSGAPQNTLYGNAGSALNQIVSYVARAKEGGLGKGSVVAATE